MWTLCTLGGETKAEAKYGAWLKTHRTADAMGSPSLRHTVSFHDFSICVSFVCVSVCV